MRYKVGDKILTIDGYICKIINIEEHWFFSNYETVYMVENDEICGVVDDGNGSSIVGRIIGNKLVKGV